MARHRMEEVGTASPPSLLRWGPVLGAAIIGFTLMLVLSTLWLALAYATGIEAVEQNLAWFMAGSLITSMLIGGFLAGWLAGVPGAAPGFFNGLTVFGLVLIVLMTASVPGLDAFGISPRAINPDAAAGQLATQGNALWAPFLALLVGALAAGLGGALGGGTTRSAAVYTGEAQPAEHDMTERMHIPPHEHRDGETVELSEPRRPVSSGDGGVT